MSKLRMSDIYACLHKTVREDAEILRLMGLTEDEPLDKLASSIQKRKKPKGVVINNLPLITFFKNPGAREENYLVYRFIVDFEIYTQDDVETAIDIADRITDLFDGKFLSGVTGSVFKGEYVTSAEDDTDLKNAYKYFVQIGFSIGLEE